MRSSTPTLTYDTAPNRELPLLRVVQEGNFDFLFNQGRKQTLATVALGSGAALR
jgi:hypothetical protein